jgi:hypothetical protein
MVICVSQESPKECVKCPPFIAVKEKSPQK